MPRPFRHSSALSCEALDPRFSPFLKGQRHQTAGAVPAIALHSKETRRGLVACLFCVALMAPANSALADDRGRLTPGLYVAATIGCDGLGGAGTVDFDGKNFSPHYQACLTLPLSQNARYRQTCIEGQGENYPTTAQIQGDPSKTTTDVTIAVLSQNSFTMNGARYDYCGAR